MPSSSTSPLYKQLYKVFQQIPPPGGARANTWLPQPGICPEIIHLPWLIGQQSQDRLKEAESSNENSSNKFAYEKNYSKTR